MKYPKIQSLYKREGCGAWDEEKQRYVCDVQRKGRKSKLIMGDYACQEFASINRWMIDEKVDGTNIRICWERNDLLPTFKGRNEDSQIPAKLLEYLQETFTRDKMMERFPDSNRVVLFGEGYGPKIQACGSRYRDDISFILFDAYIDGWWLEKDSVIEIADQLDIEYTTGHLILSTQQVVDYVKSRPISHFSIDRTLVMEGVIARAYPLMLFRQRHEPIMFKLKVSDFDD